MIRELRAIYHRERIPSAFMGDLVDVRRSTVKRTSALVDNLISKKKC
jgi:hypothetical protein